MHLLPHKNETLVVAHSWDVVLKRLTQEIEKPLSFGIPSSLSGWVKDDEFEVTLKVRRYHAFIPVIRGSIEPTANGCILFLEYRMLRFNRFFILIWTFFLIVSGIVLLIYKDMMFGGICLGMVLLLHTVAWANFRLHLKSTREIFLKALA
ncbi:MAG TPA: hypothetical protein VD884_13520 [Ohtaekwangia sp.]|nr:hypothetical protein [Ohtaekwangia sp.]